MADDSALQGRTRARHGSGVLLTRCLTRKAVIRNRRHGNGLGDLHRAIGPWPYPLTVIRLQLLKPRSESWLHVLFQNLYRGVDVGIHVDNLVAVSHGALLIMPKSGHDCCGPRRYATGRLCSALVQAASGQGDACAVDTRGA